MEMSFVRRRRLIRVELKVFRMRGGPGVALRPQGLQQLFTRILDELKPPGLFGSFWPQKEQVIQYYQKNKHKRNKRINQKITTARFTPRPVFLAKLRLNSKISPFLTKSEKIAIIKLNTRGEID